MKHHLPFVVNSANIIKGFRRTGVFSFNRNTFQDSEFLGNFVTNSNDCKSKEAPYKPVDEMTPQVLDLISSVPSCVPDIPSQLISRPATPIEPTPEPSNRPDIPQITPEQIRPHPKAGARVGLNVKAGERRKRLTAILKYDTPIKDALEAEQNASKTKLSRKTPANNKKHSHNQSFPHGSWVEARCKEPLGLYKLQGPPRLTCQNGAWNQSLPVCIPTTLLTNYTEDAPPTILVRLPSGSASAEPSGSLAVVPDSIIHLECLFSRQLGNPEWSWTSRYRNYLTGWAIAPEERGWKYRLSIYYTKAQDSGIFTCSTPRGLTNSLNLLVLDVECPRLVSSGELRLHSEGHKLGQSVHFHCPTGFRLSGSATLTCRATGRWSGEMPSCEPILCPKLEPEDPRLTLSPHNTTFGSRVTFTCPWGYRLIGPPGLECGLDSAWSADPPVCSAVRCPSPQTPAQGRLVEDESGGEYGVGSVIQFSCKPGHTLLGEGSIVCTESGVWSAPPPLCRVHCDYPGEPANGRIEPLKFTYEPGDRLKVTCHPGFVAKLEARPFCKSDGNWSQPVPECRNYKDV